MEPLRDRAWLMWAVARLYTGFRRTGSLVQALEAQQRVSWRTGQLVVRDTFSYLPEGEFGASGAWGLGSVGGGSWASGIPGIFNSGQLGALGQEPRITNMVVADMVEGLTPRTALTFAGGYGLVHFTDNSDSFTQNSAGFVDSNTASAQAALQLPAYPQGPGCAGVCLPEFQFPQPVRDSC